MADINSYRQQIEAALKFADDSHSFEDIAASVKKGELQFWPGFSSVVITEIMQFPRYRALNLFLAGGNIPELQSMLPGIEEFAESIGADRIVLTGRKGWLRSFLVHEGYGEKMVTMEKKLHGKRS
jgi:hypothetical protein